MLKTKKLIQFITVLILAQAACGLPRDTPPTLTPDLPVTFTHVAETRIAATQRALIPSLTPTPTPTYIPSPTPTLPCDVTEFVGDITLPDQTILTFGTIQNKTWRLKNVGACTWTKQYNVTFERGDPLGANTAYPLPNDVPPGSTVDITIPITAPNTYGYFQGYWVLRNSNGQVVNRPSTTDPTFWVKIIASDATFDFVKEACRATWSSSSSGKLNCPGRETDGLGYIIPMPFYTVNQVIADDNKIYSYGLLMSAGTFNDSSISGIYLINEIRNGDRLRAQIGCLHKETPSNCNIRFQLTISGEPTRNLEERYEIADGQLTTIDIDLSAFIGKNILLTLTVITNGIASDNVAFWVAPRIVPYSQP